MQRPHSGLPLQLRNLFPQESDLTTEIRYRNRRAAIADVANVFAAILSLETVIPESVEFDLSRRRSGHQTERRVSGDPDRYVALV